MKQEISTFQTAILIVIGILLFWSLFLRDIPRQNSYMTDKEAEAYELIMGSH